VVVPPLGLPSHPAHPPHRRPEIGKALGPNQPTPPPFPGGTRRQSGGRFRRHRPAQPTGRSGRLKGSVGKFFAVSWGQPPDDGPKEPEQPPDSSSGRVVPKIIHRRALESGAVDAGVPCGCACCSRRLLRTFSLKILHE
jgi:hypothetical protein